MIHMKYIKVHVPAMDKYVPVMWEMFSERVLLITNPDTTYFPPSVEAKWAYNEASVLSGLSIGSQPAPRSLVKMHIIWLSGTADGNRKQPIIQNHRHLYSALKIKTSCTFMHIFYCISIISVSYMEAFSAIIKQRSNILYYFKNGKAGLCTFMGPYWNIMCFTF